MAEPSTAGPRHRLVLWGVMGAVFLGAMESTCVATAMPTVVASLGGIAVYSWVFSAFVLAATVAMPIWGRLADQLGPRRTYLVGLGLFLLGSILSGLARSMTELIVFRAVQGLGAGSLYPVGMTIIGDLHGPEGRARMQGYFSGVWGLASLVGPLLGGLIADTMSWRWVFYVNVPPGLLAALAIARGLDGVVAAPARRARVDYAGMVVFACAVTALLVALVEGGRSAAWLRVDILGFLGASAVLLGVFIRIERRAAEPVIPAGLLAVPMIRAAVITGLFSSMAMFGAITYVPLYLQAVTGSSAMRAGLVLTPFVFAWVACSVLGARLVLRVGYRSVVIPGMAALALAFVLLTGWSEALSLGIAVRDVILAGAGMGLVFVPMLIAAQSAVPRAQLGAATSVTMFSRSVGGAVGVAVMGSVMAHRLHGDLVTLAAGAPQAARAALADLLAHPDLIVRPLTRAALGPETVSQVRGALAHAMDGVFAAGLVMALLALASAFLVPAVPARELAAARERVVRSP